MKKLLHFLAATAILMVLFASTALAAGWTKGQGANTGRWWYDLGNGQYYTASSSVNGWQWLDGNTDGIAECYAFDQDGWLYTDTTTPDGYQVNADGAWIENGIVQTKAVTPGDSGEVNQVTDGGRILIAYFSRTGTTRTAANLIQTNTGGTLFEILPQEAYPAGYDATTARAQREINAGTLPAIQSGVENIADYDMIFIGYPIWWDTTPPVVNTFLSTHNLEGKTIIPFCTSGGSGISGSLTAVNRLTAGSTVLEGIDARSATDSSIRSWLTRIGIIE